MHKGSYLGLVLLSLILVACQKSESQSQSNSKKSEIRVTQNKRESSEESKSADGTDTKPSSQSEIPSESTPSSSQDTGSIPSALVGTWTGSSPSISYSRMTITKEGHVSVHDESALSPGAVSDQEADVEVTKVADNLYFWNHINGSNSSLLPGVTGVGWAAPPGYRFQVGFRLEGKTFIPLLFRAEPGQDFDLTNPTDYKAQFTKD